MKKNFTLLALIMLGMMTTLVSCDVDDDDYKAYNLEGAWQGDMGVMIDGYVADYSTIYFDRDPYRYASGTGYQVDYFTNRTPWYHRGSSSYYLANHIEWTVEMGVIHIYYMEEDVYARIRDYRLYSDYFEGYIDFEDGSSSRFRLEKTYSPNNWGSYYDWGYDYYGWGFGYAKQGMTDNLDTRGSIATDTVAKPKRTAAK